MRIGVSRLCAGCREFDCWSRAVLWCSNPNKHEPTNTTDILTLKKEKKPLTRRESLVAAAARKHGMPENTLKYWMDHPSTVYGRKDGSGRKPTIPEGIEKAIDSEFESLPDKTKANLKAIALRRFPSENFKCTDTWVRDFSERWEWHWWIRHVVSAARFNRVKKSMEQGQEPSEEEKDMVYCIANVLAKRALMSERGLHSKARW